MSGEHLRPAQHDLVQAALIGDRQALSSLVADNYERIFGYLVRLSGDYHLAQDLTQETFYRMWQKLPSLRESAPFQTWLYRIAHNAFLDHARSWHHRNVKPSGALGDERAETGAGRPLAAPESRDPDPVVSMVEMKLGRSQAARLLGGLSPEHRSVVVLRVYHDLGLEAIAEVLDIPLGTVKSRLHHAFRLLRRMVGEPLAPARAGWGQKGDTQ